MDPRHKLAAIASGAGLAIGLALWQIRGPLAGWSFLAGAAVGALSFASLIALTRGSARVGQGRTGLPIVVQLIKFPVLLLVLYLLIVPGQANVWWLCLGYTAALLVFLLGQFRARPAQVGTKPTEKDD